MQKKLILASASPRRRELLALSGYEFEIRPSAAEEIKGGIKGAELARLNALTKARDIYESNKNSVVLGADTVVCLGDRILGKPKDATDAFNMLKSLSGTKHSVITGFALVGEQGEKSGFCETLVSFNTLSEEEINAYVATNEPMDKAGAYGIQERASLFVSHIEGDYFNVMGLPVASLYPLLKTFGIKPKWQNDVL